MTNRDIAHQWASGRRTSGKGSHFSYTEGDLWVNIYCDGVQQQRDVVARIPRESIRDLSSYSTVVARRIETPTRTLFLITTRSYSVTTSKHVGYAQSAAHGNGDVFLVDNVLAMHGDHHDTNVREMVQRAAKYALQSKRARTDFTKHNAARAALGTLDSARKYAIWFGVDLSMVPSNPDDLAARLAESEKRAREESARRKAANAQRLADRVTDFRNGIALHALPSLTGLPVMLRVVSLESGRMVETSHGATVPYDAARRLWERWTRDDAKHGEHIGYYTVQSVRATSMQIGCHTIPRDEANRLAANEGWTTPDVNAECVA